MSALADFPELVLERDPIQPGKWQGKKKLNPSP